MTKLTLSLAVGSTFLVTALAACRASEPEPGQIAIAEAKALEQLHYTRHQLDDSVSDRLLHTYIETFDFNRLFFTQSDIDGYEKKYDKELDDAIWLGDMKPAQVIYDTYLKHVEARVAKIKHLLETEKFDFDGHGTIEISRLKAPWPKDEADADRLWHDRIENELLTEHLAETTKRKEARQGPRLGSASSADHGERAESGQSAGRERLPRAGTRPNRSSPSATTGCCVRSTSRPGRTWTSSSSTPSPSATTRTANT